MSKAYKCDRCGALFSTNVTNRKLYVTTSRYVSGICADLCDECQEQLDRFMQNKDAVVSVLIDDKECSTCEHYHSSACIYHCENHDRYTPIKR